MPTARKKLEVVDPPQAEELPTYDFEPMTEDLQSRLNVWGNSTMLTITQIQDKYPEWARCLVDMLTVLRNVAESQES